MTITGFPRTIRASVHQDAISKVPDFFNASLRDILNELLQNSRRSGATKVDVTLQNDRVTVADDGQGIDDPQTLLDFGRSQWDQQLTRSEHPAGMGLYALARLDSVRIRSKTEDGLAWAVWLSTANFTGQEPAHVDRIYSRVRRGTTVTFRFPGATTGVIEACARYYPLPTTLNGESLKRQDFLEKAVHLEEWEGLRIGVNRNSQHNLNFHGVVVQEPDLPSVPTVQGAWHAAVDVTGCPGLSLTLPARRELVETAFTQEMRQACRAAIYRAIQNHPEPVDLPKKEHEQAASLGVRLPEARRFLEPWQPQHADPDGCREYKARQHVGTDALLMQAGHLPVPDQVSLARAAGENGDDARMMQPDPDMAGYGWYDRLARMTGLSITVADEDGEHNLRQLRARKESAGTGRPDSIRLTLHGRNPQGKLSLAMDTDLAFENSSETFAEDNRPLVTKDSSLEAHELASLLNDAYFVPWDDAEADSYETQQERHTDKSLKIATALLHSEEEAATAAITSALYRHVLHEVPSGMEAAITIHRRRGQPSGINVTLIPLKETSAENQTKS